MAKSTRSTASAPRTDTIKKYSKIHRIGHAKNKDILSGGKLVLTEKMDGASFRFKLDREHDSLLFGSRNVEFREEGGQPAHALSGAVNNNFRKAARHIEKTVDVDDIRSLESHFGAELVFFGENMVKHTLEYDWENIPIFLGFDIYNASNENYLRSFDKIQSMFHSLGLDTTQKLDEISAEDFDPTEYTIPESEYRDGRAEGVVIRNETMDNYRTSSNWRAKLLAEGFEEKREKTFGKTKKQAETDTEEVVAKYCTEARIEKHINKLTVDEGKDLAMELMEDLPMRIAEDIIQEEYADLVRSNYNIDMKDFRSKIADRCVAKLKRKITNNAINNDDV